MTSITAGLVVFVTLLVLGVPFPVLWAVWVALVDFLPMIGGALAGIPTVLSALGHSLTAGIVTLAVFLVYTQVENHVLNPVVMSRTVRVNPLLVLLAIVVGASLGDWIGGIFGAFVAALLAIPAAGALQVIVREVWQETAPENAARAQEAAPGNAARAQEAAPGTRPRRRQPATNPPGGTDRVLPARDLRAMPGSSPRRRSAGRSALARAAPGDPGRPEGFGPAVRWLRHAGGDLV